MGANSQVSSLAEQAYLRLHQEILTCILSPGQVVSERELAGQYEMSKTPIREALTQVCHDGLMQRLPGRGYMVAPITIKDIRDLFDLRLILEVAATERAARDPSPAHIAMLKEMSSITYHLDDRESHILFLKANRSFHLALAEVTKNRRLEGVLDGLLVELDRVFHLGLRLRDSSEEMRREHQQVVAALEAGDVEGARDAITRQIINSRDRIMEAIMQGDIQPIQVSGQV
jgi:DNA-binding GntR family transcriptional regulator